MISSMRDLTSDLKSMRLSSISAWTKNCGTGSKIVEQVPKNVDQGPRNLEQGPRNVEQGPKNLEQRPRNVEQGSRNLEYLLQKETGAINRDKNHEEFAISRSEIAFHFELCFSSQ